MPRLTSKQVYLAVMLASCVAVIGSLAAHNAVIRVVLGLPLALLLPGFALTALLLPQRKLTVAEWLAYTVGLSLACLVLSGLVLNLTLWGLTPESWIVLLGLIALAASGLAYRRQQRQPQNPIRSGVPESFSLSLRQLTFLALTGAVTLTALAVALAPSPQQAVEGYTVLWADRGADDNAGRIVFGVDSKELSPERYRLEVTIADRLIRQWPAISLAPGETFTASLTLDASALNNSPLAGTLYRLDQPETVYRQVIMPPNLQ